MSNLIHQFNDGKYDCKLFVDGTFTVNGRVAEWYKENAQTPWIPKKFQAFRSLVKQMIREGDFE